MLHVDAKRLCCFLLTAFLLATPRHPGNGLRATVLKLCGLFHLAKVGKTRVDLWTKLQPTKFHPQNLDIGNKRKKRSLFMFEALTCKSKGFLYAVQTGEQRKQILKERRITQIWKEMRREKEGEKDSCCRILHGRSVSGRQESLSTQQYFLLSFLFLPVVKRYAT